MLHALDFSNDIHTRIQLLQVDGALDALQSTGLIEEALKLTADGYPPDGSFIAKALLISGISSSWIERGEGSAYPVSYLDDESAAEFLDLLLSEEDHTIYVIAPPEDCKFCVQTSVPTWWDVRGEWIPSHSTELIAGDLGPAVRKRLREAKRTHKVYEVQISQHEFKQLQDGWMRLTERASC